MDRVEDLIGSNGRGQDKDVRKGIRKLECKVRGWERVGRIWIRGTMKGNE